MDELFVGVFMADRRVFKRIRDKFLSYTDRFAGDTGVSGGIKLKIKHSMAVCNNAMRIGRTLNVCEEVLWLIGISAILHDIGRFMQFEKYGTFIDEISVDHGDIGVVLLEEENILSGLNAYEKEIVRFTVKHHNKPGLPLQYHGDKMCVLKVVRDADKLDILRVVLEHYESRDENTFVELGLPNKPGISEKAVKDILSGRVVSAKHVKKLNDLKLLYISWVHDMNFNITINIFKERNYLERIKASLQEVESIEGIINKVKGYINERINEHSERRCT